MIDRKFGVVIRCLGSILAMLIVVQAYAVSPPTSITNTATVTYSDTVGIQTFTDADSAIVTVNLTYSISWGTETGLTDSIQGGTTSTNYTTRLTNNGNGTINRVFITNDTAGGAGSGGNIKDDAGGDQVYTYTADGNFSAVASGLGVDNAFSLFAAVASGASTGGDCTSTNNCTIPLFADGWVLADIPAGATLSIDGQDCVFVSGVDGVSITVNSCTAALSTLASGATVNEYIEFDFTALLSVNEDIASDTLDHDFTAGVYTNDCSLTCGIGLQQTTATKGSSWAVTTVLGPVATVYKYVRNITTGGNNPSCGGGVECVVYNGNTYYSANVVADQSDDLQYLMVFTNTADASYDTQVDLTTNCNTVTTGELDDCDTAATGTMGYADGVVIDDTIPTYTTMQAASNVFLDENCNGTVVDGTETYGNEASGVVRINAGGTGVAGDVLYFYMGSGADDESETGAQTSGGQVSANDFSCGGFTTRVD